MTLLEQINKLVPEPIKAQIKELALKFNAVPPVVAPAVAPVNLAAIETKLKDGTTLSVDKMEVGGKAQIISETGAVDAPDATYEAEDGTLITCASGLITEIKPATPLADPAPVNPDPAMYAALAARLTAIETNFTAIQNEKLALKTELEALRGANNLTLSAVNLILSAPAGDPVTHKPSHSGVEKTYEEMSNNEKVRFKRGEKIYK